MHKSTPTAEVREALRRLSAPHALTFGHRLLSRGSGRAITFLEFIDVARELVAQRPEQSAVYLAALVALDMSAEDQLEKGSREPSTN